MTGIVDVGGGMRAVFGAGVFDYFMDHGIRFPYCLGVSAGSANVVTYLARQRGRNLKFYTEYALRKEYMGLRNWLKTGSYVNLDYTYSTLTNSGGENPVDYEALVNSGSILKVVATNALTGKPVYFDQADFPKDNYGILKASSAVPVFCKPYNWEGQLYFDGGIGDPIPAGQAFTDGCDRLVVILTRPLDYIRTEKRDALMVRLLRRRYPQTAEALKYRSQKYNDTVVELKALASEGKALILAPDNCCSVDTLTRNAGNMKRLYQKGYLEAQKIHGFLK